MFITPTVKEHKLFYQFIKNEFFSLFQLSIRLVVNCGRKNVRAFYKTEKNARVSFIYTLRDGSATRGFCFVAFVLSQFLRVKVLREKLSDQ